MHTAVRTDPAGICRSDIQYIVSEPAAGICLIFSASRTKKQTVGRRRRRLPYNCIVRQKPKTRRASHEQFDQFCSLAEDDENNLERFFEYVFEGTKNGTPWDAQFDEDLFL